ncbi:MAG: D-alanyl-D-alanine carboxypeptidase [Hespellia sp.]|nr:D-alanyl-D-alanine carboxypeptidase [Hespellia sp.]
MNHFSRRYRGHLKHALLGLLVTSIVSMGSGTTAFATDGSTPDSTTATDTGAAGTEAAAGGTSSSAGVTGTIEDGSTVTLDPSQLDDTVLTQTPEQRQAEEDYVYAEPINTNSIENWPQGPSVYAQSAIVMDMNSGAVLFGKNIDEKHYPASITKLLTVLVALKNAEVTDKVTFTDDCISFLESGDASIGMKAGEELTLENAFYGVLLASANEVSYAVAESVGTTRLNGGYQTFIDAMNTTAEEIGCENSHWMNANGLHDKDHYTTAHDMARIGAAVYKFDEFRKITQTLSYEIPATNLTAETRWVQQNHKMLWPENQYYYANCTGGKTGYTDQAHTTLVTMADNNELQLVAVNLRSYGGVTYTDTAAMMDYAFNNFSKITLKDQEKSDKIKEFVNQDAYVVVPNGVDFSSLDSEIEYNKNSKDKQGTISYTYEGQNVGTADIVLSDSYYEKLTSANFTPTEGKSADSDTKSSGFELPLFVKVILAAVVVLAVLLFIWIRYVSYRKRKMRQRRRAQMRKRREAERRDHPERTTRK